jgi:copper homeostasis protein (lipoprotein)
MGGMVTYMADAAIFEECLTGRTYPVAIEGAWIDLERAYLGAVEGGTPLYATIEGTISLRPAMEGPDRRTVTVDRFVGVYPGQTCERARANASLVNTFWKITDLGGTPVAPAEGNREPFLVLREDSFNATVGCNMMRGGYESGDGTLTFGPAASTMMACPEPLDGWERSLADAGRDGKTYAIAGRHAGADGRGGGDAGDVQGGCICRDRGPLRTTAPSPSAPDRAAAATPT